MFGESDSESPRVPSPWDCLISTPPSPAAMAHNDPTENIPKLVPEAEEVSATQSPFILLTVAPLFQGNIEYKLQLLSPSPARFARLVTQMKWRLLEGGGQAYYELGVADSGALVGLPRAELEQSLETLEMMAGEIGASVIVVKEVEVPAFIAGLAGSETDYWNSKRLWRKSVLQSDTSEGDSTTSTTEFESELSNDRDDDMDEFRRGSLPGPYHHLPSVISSSPTSDPPLTSPHFRPDPETVDGSTDLVSAFSDLEIASVFKPLPMRVRGSHSHVTGAAATHPFQLNRNNRTHMAKQEHHQFLHPADSRPSHKSTTPNEVSHMQTKQQAKALHRRHARDRKREAKRMASLAQAAHSEKVTCHQDCTFETSIGHSREDNTFSPVSNKPSVKQVDPAAADLASELAAFHVSVEAPKACRTTEPIPIPGMKLIPDLQLEEYADDVDMPLKRDAHHGDCGKSYLNEPRLIVEALVVRKMSLEDAFLDFGGFSLT
jgi:hypothetical protein